MAEFPRPRKRLGQHFLHDRGVVERILACVDPRPGEHFAEIGPGRGALTLSLLDRLGALDAVELDRDLIEPLAMQARAHGTLRLHRADALQFGFAELNAGRGALRVIGNLPYNISTPLLFHLTAQRASIRDVHVMLQKEVVERMAAAPGGSAYGRLSVMIQFYWAVESLFTIGRGAFQPPPKVQSAFVRLRPRAEPAVAVEDAKDLAELVRRAFSARRKTVRNALKGVMTESELRELGVDPGLRPERIDIPTYARMANLWRARRKATDSG